MYAQTWHNYCTVAVPAEPAPLTKRQWASLSEPERSCHLEQLEAWLQHLYVQSEQHRAIAQIMTDTVRRNACSPPGAKTVLALTGPNLVGKSTLMKRWGREKYQDWVRGADQDERGRPVVRSTPGYEDDLCPVVWINLLAGARIKDFDAQILSFFGLPTVGVTRSLSEQALRAMGRHRSRVLVVDDTHLLYTNWKGGRDVLDHVKHINTELGELGATLVLIGAELEDSDIVRDPQIAGRLKLQTLEQYSIDNEHEMRTWADLVEQLENSVLPHLPASRADILCVKLAGELWLRTQGYLGDLTKLVADATLAAVHDGSFNIRQHHLDGVELSAESDQYYRVKTGEKRRALQDRSTRESSVDVSIH